MENSPYVSARAPILRKAWCCRVWLTVSGHVIGLTLANLHGFVEIVINRTIGAAGSLKATLKDLNLYLWVLGMLPIAAGCRSASSKR